MEIHVSRPVWPRSLRSARPPTQWKASGVCNAGSARPRAQVSAERSSPSNVCQKRPRQQCQQRAGAQRVRRTTSPTHPRLEKRGRGLTLRCVPAKAGCLNIAPGRVLARCDRSRSAPHGRTLASCITSKKLRRSTRCQGYCTFHGRRKYKSNHGVRAYGVVSSGLEPFGCDRCST